MSNNLNIQNTRHITPNDRKIFALGQGVWARTRCYTSVCVKPAEIIIYIMGPNCVSIAFQAGSCCVRVGYTWPEKQSIHIFYCLNELSGRQHVTNSLRESVCGNKLVLSLKESVQQWYCDWHFDFGSLYSLHSVSQRTRLIQKIN